LRMPNIYNLGTALQTPLINQINCCIAKYPLTI
jgi:hypothetical protein